MEDYFRIGVITAPQGVRGEVRVYPTTDDRERFRDLSDCYMLCPDGSMQPVKAEGCKFLKSLVVLKLEGYDDRDSVEALRNRELYVDREHAATLSDGGFYYPDIIGLSCISDGKTIGTVRDYFDTAASQTVIVVDTGDGEKLIPAVPAFLKKVDVDGGYIEVSLIKGM